MCDCFYWLKENATLTPTHTHGLIRAMASQTIALERMNQHMQTNKRKKAPTSFGDMIPFLIVCTNDFRQSFFSAKCQKICMVIFLFHFAVPIAWLTVHIRRCFVWSHLVHMYTYCLTIQCAVCNIQKISLRALHLLSNSSSRRSRSSISDTLVTTMSEYKPRFYVEKTRTQTHTHARKTWIILLISSHFIFYPPGFYFSISTL